MIMKNWVLIQCKLKTIEILYFKKNFNQICYQYNSLSLNFVLFLLRIEFSFDICSVLFIRKDLSLCLFDNSSYKFPIVAITISGQ